MTKILGMEIPYNRANLQLGKQDRLVVFQLLQRLNEGAVLSEEEVQKIPHKWYLVEVID